DGWKKVVANPRRPADMHSNKVAHFYRGLIFVLAVEPAEVHIRIGRTDFQHDLSFCLETIREAEWADAIGIVTILAAAPERTAKLTRSTTHVIRVTETKVMRANGVGLLVRLAIC